jgi:hypothetical protein
MKLPLTGGCLCGAVRYEIIESPKRMGLCHCRSCQRATGSAYYPFVATSANTLKTQGEFTWYGSIGDSGHKVSRGFCPKCGSMLFGKHDVLTDLRTVSASSLDNPLIFKPEIAVWLENALPWHDITRTLILFDKNSPVLQKAIDAYSNE